MKHLTIKPVVTRLQTIDINLLHREGYRWRKDVILSGEYDVLNVIEGDKRYSIDIDLLLSKASTLIIEGHPLKGTPSVIYISVPKAWFKVDTCVDTCPQLRASHE